MPDPNAMQRDPAAESRAFAKLTDRERQCLRLVRAQQSSKEIGLALGLDAGTVDQHIKSAMRVLGVHKRGLAALALDAHERDTPERNAPDATRETLDIQSPDIAAPIDPAFIAASMDRGGMEGAAGSDHMLREAYAPFRFVPTSQLPLPLRPAGGRRNGLTAWQTIGLSVAVMFFAMLCLGVLIDGVGALGRVGASVQRHLR